MPGPYTSTQNQLVSPLVRKPKRKATSHRVEGRNPLAVLTRPNAGDFYDTRRGDLLGGDNRDNLRMDPGYQKYQAAKSEYDEGIAQGKQDKKDYALEDAARARIKPIADPDAGKAEKRKRAARLRMRGRLGTMLSQRDTLG